MKLFSTSQQQLQIIYLEIIILSGILFLVWLSPPSHALEEVGDYLPLHLVIEMIAVIIAILTFLVGWNTYNKEIPDNILILASLFLGVGLLDFVHLLSYPGMPNLITPSGPEKAIEFWLAARLLAVLALLAVALLPSSLSLSRWSQYGLPIGVLLFTFGFIWLSLFHHGILPPTFIPGKGLTEFKVAMEYLLISLSGIVALAFYRQLHKPQYYDMANLFAAVMVMALSEICFTLYREVTDIFNLLGHVYKIISFLFIYRAIFLSAIQVPYQQLYESKRQLQQAQQALRDSEARYRAVSELTSDCAYALRVEPDDSLILEWVTDAFHRVTGYSKEEVLALGNFIKLVHPHDIATVWERGKIFFSGKSDSCEFRIVTKSGEVRWVLNYGYPQWDEKQHRVVRIIGAVQDITMKRWEEKRLAELNHCFTSFGASSSENINRLVALCGELMYAEGALYHRLKQGVLDTIGQWQLPTYHDSLQQLIEPLCYQVVEQRSEEILIINNLPPTSDTFGKSYQWKTFLGQVVISGNQVIGSLCVVYSKEFTPQEPDRRFMKLIAAAVSVEEERKRAEETLREERAFLQNIIDGVPDPIMVIRENYQVILMNRRAREGIAKKTVMRGDICYQMLCERSAPCVFIDHSSCPMEQVRHSATTITLEQECVDHQGERRIVEICAAPLWNADGSLMGIIESSRDITERERVRKELLENQARLNYLAYHDPLTNLPNRLLFNNSLTQAIVNAQEQQTQVALLFLDLDRFKNVNDTLGHYLGDNLLQAVARRLQETVEPVGTVARLGGDEFTVIMENIVHTHVVAKMAQDIISALAKPFIINYYELYLGTSIGISLYPSDGNTVEMLTKNADTAMYLAKTKGRGNYQFFTEELNRKAMRQLKLEMQLRKALEQQKLEVFYQPQVDPHTGKILGMEALVRWPSTKNEFISPLEFIPLAEENGLILPLGEWVMRTACAQTKQWQEQGFYQQLKVAVNLSAQQFRQPDLVDMVNAILLETGLNPECLELELTESILVEGAETAINLMRRIKQLGVNLALDDFGTGYSSLSYLKRFPLTNLKIAQEFVRDLTIDPHDAAIAQAVMLLARKLGLKVIAEGVETKEHLVFFQAHSCDLVQGYFFSRPVPAEKFRQLLENDHCYMV
jgi:diguanylate cyclase (GGDEF)-like protein/PAS domain S-box-containing protein